MTVDHTVILLFNKNNNTDDWGYYMVPVHTGAVIDHFIH